MKREFGTVLLAVWPSGATRQHASCCAAVSENVIACHLSLRRTRVQTRTHAHTLARSHARMLAHAQGFDGYPDVMVVGGNAGAHEYAPPHKLFRPLNTRSPHTRTMAKRKEGSGRLSAAAVLSSRIRRPTSHVSCAFTCPGSCSRACLSTPLPFPTSWCWHLETHARAYALARARTHARMFTRACVRTRKHSKDLAAVQTYQRETGRWRCELPMGYARHGPAAGTTRHSQHPAPHHATLRPCGARISTH